MRRNKRELWKLVIPIIFWIGLIFFFSSQPYQKQDMTPMLGEMFNQEGLKNLLTPIHFHYSGREISVERSGVAKFIEFFIRKGAHLFIFFVLGLLTVRVFAYFYGYKWKTAVLSILFVFSYAGLDEIHQHFTGNRTPLFADVLLDTTGGLIAIFLLLIRKKRQAHKSSNSSLLKRNG